MSADFAGAAATLAGSAGVVFGWSPEVFWSATPAELQTLVAATRGAGEGGDAVDRDTLDALMRVFPDG